LKQNHIFYGGDYNPEQWPEEVWQEDMQLMKKAGVNFVSINIFSWSSIEKDEGKYDFSKLDKIMNLLAENQIGVDLATATASPPPWVARRYPETLPVSKEGEKYLPGSRQHYCPNSEDYKRLASKLVEKIAKRYAHHPALVMWHVNNEYGCHINECYCDNCRNQFRKWLKEKYKTIDVLNKAWSTDFWSQRYYDWEEINLPGKTPTYANPNQQVDYKRFMNDSILNLYKLEHDIIKKYSKDIPVTTNLMGLHKPINGFMWSKDMDIVSWDAYPDPYRKYPLDTFLAHDLTRSLKKKPFLLMEQAPSAVNWRAQNSVKKPNQMRLWSYEAIAHGADGVMFFQWRASQGGAEKFHSGMVPHSGDENSRTFKEIVQLGNELLKLTDIIGSNYASQVAILFDWENWWALELDSKPSDQVKYVEEILTYYEILYKLNIGVDFVSPNENLEKYKIIFAPASYQVSELFSRKVKEYVANGGLFVTNYFSGIVDQDERIYLGGYPGAYKDVLGIYIEEFAPMEKGKEHQIITNTGEIYANSIWEEKIHLKSARSLAYFNEGYLKGSPAITVNQYYQGTALYIGTKPQKEYLEQIIHYILKLRNVQTSLEVPEDVEITKRYDENNEFYFILNHSNDEKIIKLDDEYINLLTGKKVINQLILLGLDVAILKKI